MTRRLSLCLSALAIGALIAGCGGSSTTSPTPSAAPASGASGATHGPGLQQAVALCRGVLRLAPNLSAADKTKLEGVCTKGASGGTEEARNAFREVCVEVIKSTPLPANEKERSVAACKARAGQ